MFYQHLRLAVIAALLHSGRCQTQTSTSSASGACPTVLTPSYSAPVVGSGYVAQLIVKGLKKPRGLLFDSNGALLVVQQGTGIVHVTFSDNGGTCLVVKKTTKLIDDSNLNHGIELSGDGRTLYASSSNEVYSWAYDPEAISVSDTKQTLVGNMSNSDHVTRTLLLSRKAPGMLLVSRGSAENMDEGAAELSTGRSEIRAFNISDAADGKPYDYPSQGKLIGWGLRNSVGVAEHPVTGGIYSVENSADQLQRSGKDIHEDNPGEEMNFHGFLNGSTESQGGNYGYPHCFALWNKNVPDVGGMKVGSQFALEQSATLNDTTCADDYVAPRLTFQAHMAPLDIKFTKDGSLAYITFHGSWNRNKPAGYKLSAVSFAGGEPVEPADSTKAAVDVLSNGDNSACPGACFRPAGLAIDGEGRIFMTSDATGEIYVLRRAEVSASGTGGGGGGTSTGGGGGGTLVTSTSKNSPNAAAGMGVARGENGLLLVSLTIALSAVSGAFFAIA